MIKTVNPRTISAEAQRTTRWAVGAEVPGRRNPVFSDFHRSFRVGGWLAGSMAISIQFLGSGGKRPANQIDARARLKSAMYSSERKSGYVWGSGTKLFP